MNLRECLKTLPKDRVVSIGESTGYYLFSTPEYLLENEGEITYEISMWTLKGENDAMTYMMGFTAAIVHEISQANADNLDGLTKVLPKKFEELGKFSKRFCNQRKRHLKNSVNIFEKTVKEYYPSTIPDSNETHIILEGSLTGKYWTYAEFKKDHPGGINFEKLTRSMYGRLAIPMIEVV